MRAFGHVTRLALPALLLAVAWAPRAGAQCASDLLDTQPCCTPVTPALPAFPAISQQTRFVCFKDCGIQVNQQICVNIAAPVPANSGGPICGVYIINFQFRTCGSLQLLWSGNIRAHYARNWQEFDPVTRRGVWRFLLNGDLKPTAVIPNNPNARPPCGASFANRVYFSGYIDYALDCTTNQWLVGFGLNHECDFASHVLGTARPLANSHPTRSYVFVGPSAGFVVDPANGPWITGGVGAESIRKNDWPSVPNICLAEEQLLAPAIINPINLVCECIPTPPGSPTQFGETVVQAFGGCGSRFDTNNPPIGPFPFVQKAIGYWTNPLTYPSPSHLFINHGTMTYNDGCSSATTTQYVEGVTTQTSGVGISSYNSVFLGNNIVDLATSNGVGGATIVGKPHVTWYLMGLNF